MRSQSEREFPGSSTPDPVSRTGCFPAPKPLISLAGPQSIPGRLIFAGTRAGPGGGARRRARPPGMSPGRRTRYRPFQPWLTSGLPVVGAEVVLLQRDGLARGLPEGVVHRRVVVGRRVHVRPRVLGRLDPQAAV